MTGEVETEVEKEVEAVARWCEVPPEPADAE